MNTKFDHAGSRRRKDSYDSPRSLWTECQARAGSRQRNETTEDEP